MSAMLPFRFPACDEATLAATIDHCGEALIAAEHRDARFMPGWLAMHCGRVRGADSPAQATRQAVLPIDAPAIMGFAPITGLLPDDDSHVAAAVFAAATCWHAPQPPARTQAPSSCAQPASPRRVRGMSRRARSVSPQRLRSHHSAALTRPADPEQQHTPSPAQGCVPSRHYI